MIRIGKTELSRENPRVYLIAECGVNYYDFAEDYDGDLLESAKQMIRMAKAAGADAVKFQAYKADRLACRESPAYWDQTAEPTASQYELFRRHDRFEVEDYRRLAAFAKELEIDFLCTCFDLEFFEGLRDVVVAHKIASADITCKPLLLAAAKDRKPVLLSCGAATETEINRAATLLLNAESWVIPLHCVLNYPCLPQHARLHRVTDLGYYHEVVGYSDHVPMPAGADASAMAAILGARVIEKHFTLDNRKPGNDHYHAADPDGLVMIRERIRDWQTLLGKWGTEGGESEDLSRAMARRSLVLVRDMPAGATIRREDLTWKRPGTGISPWEIDRVIGGKLFRDVKADVPLDWSMIV